MIAINGKGAGSKGKRKRKKVCVFYQLSEVNRKWLSIDHLLTVLRKKKG